MNPFLYLSYANISCEIKLSKSFCFSDFTKLVIMSPEQGGRHLEGSILVVLLQSFSKEQTGSCKIGKISNTMAIELPYWSQRVWYWMANIHIVPIMNPCTAWSYSLGQIHHYFDILWSPRQDQDMSLLLWYPSEHSSWIPLLQSAIQVLKFK